MKQTITAETSDPTRLELVEAATLVKSKEISPRELTKSCLNRIEKLNPLLNAFITVTGDSALAQAIAAEEEISRGGWRGILHGIPVALKDLIDTAGVKTTAASALYEDNVPAQDAEVVRKLKQAGAIVLGKLNLHEFAYGGSGVVSHYGPARNPWNVEHFTGGSSSGSAAAVAAGLCYAALGTDTSGSIRLPSSYCGIVGLKPTYGLVSVRGVIPLSWAYDHVGPMTRTVADSAAVLQAIAAYDQEEIYSTELGSHDYMRALEENPRRLRIGIARENFWMDIDPEIESALQDAVRVLKKMGGEIKEATVPVDDDRSVFRAEAYAFHQGYLPGNSDQYQPETLNRIRTGAEVSSSQYILKFQQLQALRRSAGQLFKEVDVLITPTSPVLPPRIDDLQANPQSLRSRELLMLQNTRPFNVLGWPTISIPCGVSRQGLPIGMQITTASGRDDLVLTVAHAYEKETDWHRKAPRL